MIRLRIALTITAGRPDPAPAPPHETTTDALVERADQDDERRVGFRPAIYPPDDRRTP